MGTPLRSALTITLALLAAACGSAGSAEPAVDQSTASLAAPSVAEAAVASGSVEIEGVVIEYVTSAPEGFQVGSTVPVLLALPPGGQDLGLARRLVENTYAPEANRLGWVVVSPAAPGGELFFDGSETLLPGFVEWIETWATLEGGALHVAGVSNGGISAFRYAALNPELVRSVITFPGFARSDDDRTALADLTNVPIRMFVGENDTSWVDAGKRTVDEIRSVGGDVELTVFQGEGHIMTSTADGTLVFELLESFR